MTRLEALAGALRILAGIGLLMLVSVVLVEAVRRLAREEPQPVYRVQVVGCVPCRGER